MAKRQTVDVVKEFIDKVFAARSDAQYDGDYTVKISAEGHTLCLAMNDMDAECIMDDELLIHFNVINMDEE